MKPVSIVASGMMTGVGLTAPSSCAAIRCAIANFAETRFMDKGGEWIIGSQVPLDQPWRGLSKLLHMVASAVRECFTQVRDLRPDSVPLLLCLAEHGRPGRLPGLDDEFVLRIQDQLSLRFHSHSATFPQGRVAGALAMSYARRLLYEDRVPACLIAGVDSFLVASSLAEYESRNRLLTSQNSNGFIPGEAGAAILVTRAGAPQVQSGLMCLGIGNGRERATIESEEPLRADGMVDAFQEAFRDAETGYEKIDYRMTDLNGEQYWFKEAALAVTRTLRIRKEEFDLWHPADCIGETGAAAVPCALAVALAAARKRYAPGGGVLCHFGSDDDERIAMVMSAN